MLTHETIKTITIDASEKSRAEEREKEREQCCRDVCRDCGYGVYSAERRTSPHGPVWAHGPQKCWAAGIRERAYQEQEGK